MSPRPDHRPPRSRGRIRAALTYAAAACTALGLLSASPVAVAAAPLTGATAAADPTARAYTPTDCNNPSQKTGYARCLSLVNTPTDKDVRARSADSGPPATALGPADIQAAYKLPSGGEGRTVAIVDAFGNSRAEEDLAVFREHHGLPACTTANGCFRKVDQRGGSDYPADDKGWATETSLDLDAVSAACPGCGILLVQADDNSLDSLGTAVGTAVRLGAKFISNSYGVDGEGADQTLYDHYYDHPGVVITVSSGDTGHVQSWPSTNPNVVSVGGTRLSAAPGTARGWSESAWADGGSGCSLFEATPAYQEGIDTGCDTRSTSDISADADPASGLGIYDTVGGDGWFQVGGTSLSAPLVAAMYALAGEPAENTYPVTYPYAYTGDSGLNDITQGTNDACGDITCTAGTGYDGPTGLGTPNGVSALTFGDGGTLTGRITGKADGVPLAGAVLRAVDDKSGRSFSTTTDADGRYTLSARTGTYRVTASLFGYADATGSGTEIAKGASTTVDLTLTKTDTRRVSGTIRDGAEQGWPLASRITVDGYPGGAVYTDPETGAYSVDLPRDATYQLHATPLHPGYHTTDLTVDVGGSDLTRNVTSVPDKAACIAPGYGNATAADFEGWTGTGPKNGWTVSGAAPGWQFDAPVGIDNMTGNSGNFATANNLAHDLAAEDTVLTSPVADLRGHAARLDFDSMFAGDDGTAATVDLSTDGGTTWDTVWKAVTDPNEMSAGHETVELPQAEGKSGVRIRFHFTSTAGELGIWQTDGVQLGGCSALTGALLTGTVSDGNTKKPVNGATVTDAAAPYTAGHTAVTAGNPADQGGRYWLFAPGAGKHTLTVSAPRYATGSHSVKITAGRIAPVDLRLETGHVVAKPAVSFDAALGRKSTKAVTFTNTGKAPVKVDLGEQSTSSKAAKSSGDAAWSSLPDYPEPIMGNAVSTYKGKVYSVGGFNRVVAGTLTTHGYVYDPAAGAWQRIADMPEPLASTSSAFVDGTLYVAGGQSSDNKSRTAVLAYHPATDTWTRAADIPQAANAAGVAVLDGKLYVVSGCVDDCTKPTKAVYRYTAASDRWTRVADYPIALTNPVCAGLADEVVCAGGLTRDGGTDLTAATYAYRPSNGSWIRLADMPTAVTAAAGTGANGRMQVVGGFSEGTLASAAAVEYDPVSGAWSALPDSNYPVFQGAVGCGLYEVGGGQSVRSHQTGGVHAEYLPGYDQCEGDDVSWLSKARTRFTLKPGHSVTVPVTADAGAVPAAGTYTAALTIGTDSPYTGQTVEVTLKAAERRHGH